VYVFVGDSVIHQIKRGTVAAELFAMATASPSAAPLSEKPAMPTALRFLIDPQQGIVDTHAGSAWAYVANRSVAADFRLAVALYSFEAAAPPAPVQLALSFAKWSAHGGTRPDCPQ
jgi:hypothetical protein